jgi:hypothetical protein
MTDYNYTSIIWLTQGKYAIVDNDDLDLILRYKWHFNGGYACTDSYGRKVYMQKFLMSTPDKMDTDHIDRNKLNNRRFNLRICTRSQNQANQKSSRGSSRFKGVSWENQPCKWRVDITKDKINAHDFIVGFQNYCSKEYNIIDSFTLQNTSSNGGDKDNLPNTVVSNFSVGLPNNPISRSFEINFKIILFLRKV